MPSFLPVILLVGYLGLLWTLASRIRPGLGERAGWRQHPLVYGLSLTVYASAWMYYGATGEAASHGLNYLPALLGPAFMAAFWMGWLRKTIWISKSYGISSISDFLAARYGKNVFVGGVAAALLLVMMLPYLGLQLKALGLGLGALSAPSSLLQFQPSLSVATQDPVFYIALVMALFAAIWGARRAVADEPHRGLASVAALEAAFSGLVFLVAGSIIVWGRQGELEGLAATSALPKAAGPDGDWAYMMAAAGISSVLMPHVFHMAVAENHQPNHVRYAAFIFPAFLFLFAVMAWPLSQIGSLRYDHFSIDPDAYLILLARDVDPVWLGIPVFLGGVAASVGVLVVSAIALSNMVTNNVLVPVFLRTSLFRHPEFRELSRRLTGMRQASLAAVILLAYVVYYFLGRHLSLYDSGRTAVAGLAQFAPMTFGALYWQQASRKGALAGLLAGTLLWAYTLIVPQMAELGHLSRALLFDGPAGIGWLKPTALLGVSSLGSFAHSLYWSLSVNLVLFIAVSQFSRQDRIEQEQAALFVNMPSHAREEREGGIWRGKARMEDLRMLMGRFLGEQKTRTLLEGFSQRNHLALENQVIANSELLIFAERQLSAVIGSASARLLISSIVVEEPVTMREVIEVLDERQALFQYSRELELKSNELIRKGNELNEAYQSLVEMDALKNEFITTVTHELRTPITAIRSLCSILYHHPDLPEEKRQSFLTTVLSESERVSRLITQVLDLEKMEAGLAEMNAEPLDFAEVIRASVAAVEALVAEKKIILEVKLPPRTTPFTGDRDRLIQVVVNLLANAVKFANETQGRIWVSLQEKKQQLILTVRDNGKGIPKEFRPYVFDKFTQFSDHRTGLKQGSGLGLSITWRIVRIHKGAIEVGGEEGEGAVFVVRLPLVPGAVEPMLTPSYRRKSIPPGATEEAG